MLRNFRFKQGMPDSKLRKNDKSKIINIWIIMRVDGAASVAAAYSQNNGVIMNKSKIIVTVYFLVTGLFVAVVGMVIHTSTSTARTGDLLDEKTLMEAAIQAAREYGLKGEPIILVADYVLGREWGPAMTASDVQFDPDMMVYVVSLKGEFEPAIVAGFPGDNDTENPFKPEGITVGINARSGFMFYLSTDPVTDLASMTTDFDRAVYEMNSKEEWPIPKYESFPLPTMMPETTAEALPK
jgi:hypothetical protein